MSNYIDISKQQRVVFVDNISYNQAKELSLAYPFAIILTETNNNGIHTIWRNGKCYSYISEVDNTPIIISTYSISLNFETEGDHAGCLSLKLGNAIGDFDLYRYSSNNGGTILYTEGDILNIKNKGELYFQIWKDTNHIDSNLLYEYNRDEFNLFRFRLLKLINGNYIEIQKNDYIQNIISKKENTIEKTSIKYVFDIVQEYEENDLYLEVSYQLLGEELNRTYHIKLQKTLDNELYWIGSGDPRNSNQIPDNNEITIDYIEQNNNWHILNNIADYSINSLSVPGGNIYVIIPFDRYLKVSLLDSNNNYIIDEENESSYQIIYDNFNINGKRYKILSLYDPSIIEFINIIQ